MKLDTAGESLIEFQGTQNFNFGRFRYATNEKMGNIVKFDGIHEALNTQKLIVYIYTLRLIKNAFKMTFDVQIAVANGILYFSH